MTAGPGPVGRLAGWLAGRQPRTRLLLAAGAGALAAPAMPPIGLAVLYLLSLPALLWLADGVRTRRGAFLLGFAHAFGFHLIGLYWVAASMLVDPAFYWMVPFGVVGLPALLALLSGLAVMGWWMLGPAGAARVLLLALALMAAEWLRGQIFTGFPWNLPGYAWVPFAPVLQLAALIGVHGLSLITLTAGLVPGFVAGPHRSRAGGALALAALIALAGGGLWGQARLGGDGTGADPGLRLRLVQPNIAQEAKWQPELWPDHFAILAELSRAPPAGAPPQVVIWPETAVPYFVADEPILREALGRLAPEGGLLLTGAPRAEGAAGGRRYYNSLIAIDDAGVVVGSYDKHHLVPFGEYMPLSGILPLQSIAGRSTDYSSGPGPRTITLPGLPPLAPSICYEIIFPGRVTGAERPAFLLNITNDGWFGVTWGPHQHLAIAIMRAVEEGLPLVRAAGTGISAVVDAEGRTLARLELGTRGFLDADLPPARPPTLFSRWGDLPFAGMMAVLAVLNILLHNRRERYHEDV